MVHMEWNSSSVIILLLQSSCGVRQFLDDAFCTLTCCLIINNHFSELVFQGDLSKQGCPHYVSLTGINFWSKGRASTPSFIIWSHPILTKILKWPHLFKLQEIWTFWVQLLYVCRFINICSVSTSNLICWRGLVRGRGRHTCMKIGF